MLKKSALSYPDYFFVFFLFSIAIFIQQHCFFNWDASWHLLAAKRIVAGGASYTTNLFDDNLPMVFWVFIPAVLMHHYTHINLLLLCNLSVDLLILISFFLCGFFLNLIYSEKNVLEKRIVSCVLLAILLIGPGYEFAQRDSIVMACLFPYITLIGAQIQHPDSKNSAIRITTGMFAAIGVAMNPFFGGLIAVLEIQRWVYQKRLLILKPEILAFSGSILSYFIIMVIFYPDYFSTIIPAFIVFCTVTNSHLIYLLICSAAFLFYAASIVFFKCFSQTKSPWFLSLWLAALSSFIVFLLHKKLWESHAIPVFFTANLLLIVLAVDLFFNKKNRRFFVLIIAVFSLSICAISSLYYHLYCYHLFQNKKSDTNRFISFFNAQPKNSSLYLFSYELVNTFSFLPYTTVNYLPAGPSTWMLVHINFPSPWAIQQQLLAKQKILADFQQKKPNFVLVDNSIENQKLLPEFIGELEKNKAFAEEWKQYHAVEKIGSYQIYRRNAGGSLRAAH